MKFVIFICLICKVGICLSDTYTVDDYVKNIDAYKANALNWTYPVNSYSYTQGNREIPACSFDGEYDFIICGGGTTGTVLANRLSEVTGWKILILEAGSDENEITDIPGMVDYLRTTNYNWGYHVYPQNLKFKGYENSSITIPRGKCVGGSSVINAMIYARGNKADFDNWEKQGCPGWAYDDVLPYFKKSENAAFPNADPQYHGKGGSLNVEYSRIFDEVGQAFLDAQQKDLGRNILDYNGQHQMGFSILQMTEINGRRDSGDKAFIKPIKNRKNLKIFRETFVTKVLIHKKTKTAYGVEYYRDGNFHYATAKKEVILSAGAFNSPQILMLSGIGPKSHLEKLGIDVINDLPVGKNLWDHLIYTSQSFAINHTYVNKDTRTQVLEYLQGKGDLTSPDNVQCIGYVNLDDPDNKDVPDIEHVLHTYNQGSSPYEYYKNIQRFTEDTYENIIKPTEGKNQWSIHSVLLHPKSRGEVRLSSPSPFEFPIIDPNYFSDPHDIDVLVKSIRDMFKIAATPAMQKYASTAINVTHPLCDCYTWGSDDFWSCMVQNLADTVHHFGGTCKMGNKTDSTTVVGPELCIHDIENLRVADCSVIPVTLSGHTVAPAYMIGEYAAKFIKSKHGISGNSKENDNDSSKSSSSSQENSKEDKKHVTKKPKDEHGISGNSKENDNDSSESNSKEDKKHVTKKPKDEHGISGNSKENDNDSSESNSKEDKKHATKKPKDTHGNDSGENKKHGTKKPKDKNSKEKE